MPRIYKHVITALLIFVLMVLMPTGMALAQTGAACQDQSFITNRTFQVLGNPQALAVGDLNGDGKQDMIVAKYTYHTENDVAVLLGDGDGGFEPARAFYVGSNPVAIQIADFNGDGRPDLVVVLQNSNRVSILLGDGTGNFGPQNSFKVGAVPTSVVAEDFNGDGRLDLAVSNFNSTNVSILLGDGEGGVGSATNFLVGSGPLSVATGDFNNDGKIDLAVVNYTSGSVATLMGDGAGSFAPYVNIPVDAHPMSLAVGDFNRDGKPDLAVVGQSYTLTILQGVGGGSFSAAAHLNVGSPPNGPTTVIAGDIDLDGKLDLAIANYYPSKVSILKGDGSGGFSAVADYTVALLPFDIKLADFDGDGRPDLATAGGNSPNIWLLRSNGTGGFLVPPVYPNREIAFPPVIKDLNGDGNVDVASTRFDDDNISVLLGNGSGGFAPKVDYPGGSRPEFLAAGDFNGDGKPDLVATSRLSNNVWLLLNNGSGGFGPAVSILSTDMPYLIVSGDFNGDGKADIALTATMGTNQVLTVLMGKGDGGFQTPLVMTENEYANYLVVGDFNRDGKSDLAVSIGSRVQVLIANATGFNAPVNYPTFDGTTPSQTVQITVGDINGDGKDDLVVVIAGDIDLLLGDGSGNFTTPKSLKIKDYVYSNATLLGDFNGDGKQDLALDEGDSIQIVYGDGTGNFVPHKGGFYAGSPKGVVDLNKDGRPDILADLGGLAVLTNVCGEGDGPTGNLIDQPEFFVRQHYYDFLSRPPDSGGLGYWTSQITRCATSDAACIHNKRLDVSNAFFYEQEFQSTGAYVYRIYKAAFGARPAFAQFLPDRGLVIGGSQLDASKSLYALVFVQRAAFVQLYPRAQSAAQFVDALLNNLKQNSGVDLSSLRGQLMALYDGTDKGRAAILRQVADNQTFVDAEYNRSFVLMEYFGYLRRDPDDGGFAFWLAQVNKFPLRNVGIQHAMVCSFITSTEYQLRFSSVITHSNRECPQ